MMESSSSRVRQIIQSSRQLLEFAELGYRDFMAAGERRPAGIYNVVSSGRAVWFALQNLRGKVDGFDEWWDSIVDRVTPDPCFLYFKKLRTKIEKQADMGSANSRVMMNFSGSPMQLLGDLPPLAPGAEVLQFVVGDSMGRNSAKVRLPDGTEQDYYFNVPPQLATVEMVLGDAPDDRGFGDLAAEYLAGLERIVGEAESRWGHDA